MPKSPSSSTQPAKSSLFVYKYNNKRVLATRKTCYNEAILDCRKLFWRISASHKITFQTKELDICSGFLTEISEDVWGEVIGNLSSVVVMTEERIQREDGAVVKSNQASVKPIALKIVSAHVFNAGNFIFNASLDDTVESIHRAASEKWGISTINSFLTFHGWRLDDYEDETIEERGIGNGDTLIFYQRLVGGKPVIYLFSPETREAEVKLSLIPQWNLSAIYPVVPIKPRTPRSNEQVVWRVRTQTNGDLKELTTGLEVAYLFWEAHTDATAPASQSLSPLCGESSKGLTENFDPNEAVLNDENSVVMPVAKITPYLDKALSALGLHTEARTSFITYWLPSILKHQHVALRFLPQASYEQAAPLEISPSPDVITRVFMVFRGVTTEALQSWTTASRRASEDVGHWREIVGVDLERALDANLFRVLEWGGMEVRTGS